MCGVFEEKKTMCGVFEKTPCGHKCPPPHKLCMIAML